MAADGRTSAPVATAGKDRAISAVGTMRASARSTFSACTSLALAPSSSAFATATSSGVVHRLSRRPRRWRTWAFSFATRSWPRFEDRARAGAIPTTIPTMITNKTRPPITMLTRRDRSRRFDTISPSISPVLMPPRHMAAEQHRPPERESGDPPQPPSSPDHHGEHRVVRVQPTQDLDVKDHPEGRTPPARNR